MKRSSAVPLVLLGLLLLIGSPTEASAGAPTDQLRASVDQIIKVLDDPALKPEGKAAERRAAIRKEAVVVFDFTETAKRALGRHWQGLSEQDRQEFTALFTDLIERAYISKI
jgi:phospholipid transport system substrate-binding protein